MGNVLVFPEVGWKPSDFSKFGVVGGISPLIRGELFGPPLRIVLGIGRMLRAGVPKAAIDEYRYPGGGENNIGGARQVLPMDPEPDAPSVKGSADGNLGGR